MAQPVLEHIFLATTPAYAGAWGTGPTPAQARANWRAAGGSRRSRIVLAPAGVTKVWVDEEGYIQFNVVDGCDPEELAKDEHWIKVAGAR